MSTCWVPDLWLLELMNASLSSSYLPPGLKVLAKVTQQEVQKKALDQVSSSTSTQSSPGDRRMWLVKWL